MAMIIYMLLIYLPATLSFLHPHRISKYVPLHVSPPPSSSPGDDADIDDIDDDDDALDQLSNLPGNLGINIGKELRLTPEEAKALKSEITSEIEDIFANRLDELSDVKTALNEEFENARKANEKASDARAAAASEELTNKIDKMTATFLEKTKASRESTKMAAAADRAMVGRGLELGSWGEDEYGKQVVMAEDGGGGSVSPFLVDTLSVATSEVKMAPLEKKVLLIASDADPNARVLKLLSGLLEEENISTTFHPPSRPAPMGGLNSQTVVIDAAGLSDRSALATILDRLTSRTAPKPGERSITPSHVVLLSSLGTDRVNKMPFSFMNMMGGALTKRREMEEAVVSKVRRGSDKRMDYTIAKFGKVETAGSGNNPQPLQMASGDALEGSISAEAASRILFQSIAYQKPARNATLSAVGTAAPADAAAWDDLFLLLDGPELLRVDLPFDYAPERFDLLNEYVGEWAIGTFGGGEGTKSTGLTTPVALERSRGKNGIRIVFKQTNTGKRYLSKTEEKELEKDDGGAGGTRRKDYTGPRGKQSREGGVEVLVDLSLENKLRVRARRCAMGDDTVVKEISEGVILKKLKNGLDFWTKQQQEFDV